MKLKAGLILLILLLVNIFTVKAQNPCDADPDSCPLDSWTYFLVFCALIFVAFRLHRRQKTRSI